MAEVTLKKKVCMLGAFAVGKTSLVRRFVSSIFDERYQTTIGTTVEKREVVSDGRRVVLMLWDLYGEDEFQRVRSSYLRGAAGCLLVVDATRAATLDVALDLRRRVEEAAPGVACVFVVNKTDLAAEVEVGAERLAAAAQGAPIVATSAKTGEGVEEAFEALTRLVVAPSRAP